LCFFILPDDAKQQESGDDNVRTGNLEEDPYKEKKDGTGAGIDTPMTPVLCANYSTIRPPVGQRPKNSRYDNAASGMVVDWFNSFYFLSGINIMINNANSKLTIYTKQEFKVAQ